MDDTRAGDEVGEITGVQVNLFCSDVERCALFFEALGMRRAFRYPPTGTPSKVEVEGAGVRVGFDALDVANEIADLGVVAPQSRSEEVAVWVTDVDALHSRAVAAGGRSLRAPMDGPDGRLRYAWVLDPEGHQVRLLQER
ncbi:MULTISPECIES: VOC family protein [unclassified Isoptericola]|uniref:VOC family protein n=1 Tax=unclassified Isoptericola TaxID=2623355 RepID=UPI00364F2D8C